MPNLTDYRVDPALTDISVGFKNDEYLADQVFPRLEVSSLTGYYYKFDKSKFRIENASRAAFARANRVGFGMTKTAFGPLTEQSLESGIEWAVRDSYPSKFDAESDATEEVTELLSLVHEKEVADMLGNTAVVTNNVTLSGTDQFSDFANSDPFARIQTAIDSVVSNGLVAPNTIIMGYEVWTKIKNHPDLLGRLSNDSMRVMTPAAFGELFGISKVLIGKAVYNTAAEGQTASMGFVWGKNMIVAYIPDRPGMRKVALGYTLTKKGARYVDAWTEQAIKSDFVRANDFYDSLFVSVEAAYLIKNAVA